MTARKSFNSSSLGQCCYDSLSFDRYVWLYPSKKLSFKQTSVMSTFSIIWSWKGRLVQLKSLLFCTNGTVQTEFNSCILSQNQFKFSNVFFDSISSQYSTEWRTRDDVHGMIANSLLNSFQATCSVEINDEFFFTLIIGEDVFILDSFET